MRTNCTGSSGRGRHSIFLSNAKLGKFLEKVGGSWEPSRRPHRGPHAASQSLCLDLTVQHVIQHHVLRRQLPTRGVASSFRLIACRHLDRRRALRLKLGRRAYIVERGEAGRQEVDFRGKDRGYAPPKKTLTSGNPQNATKKSSRPLTITQKTTWIQNVSNWARSVHVRLVKLGITRPRVIGFVCVCACVLFCA